MKFPSSFLPLVALALPGFPAAATAADPAAFRWHVEAGPSLWLNTRVTFGANAGADPAAGPKSDRFYDDGFNRVDASGNLGDGSFGPLASRTGYFGFSNDSQVDLRAGTLALRRVRLAGVTIWRRRRRRSNRPGMRRCASRCIVGCPSGATGASSSGLIR